MAQANSSVFFTDIRPAEYLPLSPNVLTNSLPHEQDDVRERVEYVLQRAPIEALIAQALPSVDSALQANSARFATDTRVMAAHMALSVENQEHDATKSFLLGETALASTEVRYRLTTAAQRYRGLVAIAGTVGHWNKTAKAEAPNHALASLAGVEPQQAWLQWNRVARDFNQRTIDFIDGFTQ